MLQSLLVLELVYALTNSVSPYFLNPDRYHGSQRHAILALILCLAKNFACNFDHAKMKYFRTSNAILGKLGKQRNPAVALQLISSISVPVLTFGLEALSLNKTQRQSLNHPWDSTFMKIYGTFDIRIVQQCQNFGGFLPISQTADLKRCEFLRKIPLTKNQLVCSVSDLFKHKDIADMANRYNATVDVFVHNFKNVIHKQFADAVALCQ